MCGRFTLTLEPGEVQEALGLLEISPDFQPHYNIAPTQRVAVVTSAVDRRLDYFRWGLIPAWAKDPGIGARLINARSETLSEKPSFRTAFTHRRCLIAADGFYEWRRSETGKQKTPFYIRLKSAGLFTFAGLWDTWRSPDGETMKSCTIITCRANELIAPLHDRMPVILSEATRWRWLSPDVAPHELEKLLTPYASIEMEAYPVLLLVNNPSNDLPECIVPEGSER
jgi:putative SOS response-associated peptidase YedK